MLKIAISTSAVYLTLIMSGTIAWADDVQETGFNINAAIQYEWVIQPSGKIMAEEADYWTADGILGGIEWGIQASRYFRISTGVYGGAYWIETWANQYKYSGYLSQIRVTMCPQLVLQTEWIPITLRLGPLISFAWYWGTLIEEYHFSNDYNVEDKNSYGTFGLTGRLALDLRLNKEWYIGISVDGGAQLFQYIGHVGVQAGYHFPFP